MFILYGLFRLMRIRPKSDRFPKHLCYKTQISFSHAGFPTRLACSMGWWPQSGDS